MISSMVANRNSVLDVLSGIFILRMVYTHTCMYAGLTNHTVLYNRNVFDVVLFQRRNVS